MTLKRIGADKGDGGGAPASGHFGQQSPSGAKCPPWGQTRPFGRFRSTSASAPQPEFQGAQHDVAVARRRHYLRRRCGSRPLVWGSSFYAPNGENNEAAHASLARTLLFPQ